MVQENAGMKFGTSRKVKTINRRFGLFFTAFVVVTVLWFVLWGILFYTDAKNTKRYQEENYNRLLNNQTYFDEMCRKTDHFIATFTATTYVLPWFEGSDKEDAMEYVVDRDNPESSVMGESPFVLDSMPYRLNTRLEVLTLAEKEFDSFAIYNLTGEYGIAVTKEGCYTTLCNSIDAMNRVLGINPSFTEADDYEIVEAENTDYASSALYVVRRVGENSMLLCGMNRKAVFESLLKENIGRSYDMIEIGYIFPDGKTIWRNGIDMVHGIDIQNLQEDGEIVESKAGITIMRMPVERFGGTVIAVLRDTGLTSITKSAEYIPLLVLNLLWMISIIGGCLYLFFAVYRPLHIICGQLPDDVVQEKSEIQAISKALGNYQEQHSTDQGVIQKQREQLRRAYLKSLTQGQRLMLLPEQLEELGITELLEKYVLVTMYPEDGLWGEKDLSIQENRYVRQVALEIIRDQAYCSLNKKDFECLTFDSYAILVLPTHNEEDEAAIRGKLMGMIAACRERIKKKLFYGISTLTEGEEHFEDAYYEAVHGRMISEDEESVDVKEDERKKGRLNLRLSKLIYTEQYAEAFPVFDELIQGIFEIRNPVVRRQSIRAQLELTVCMLRETNAENSKLLNEYKPGLYELIHLQEKEDILNRWSSVFFWMNNCKKERIEQEQRHFSGQFEQIYKYVLDEYHDPNLSLSMLAERSGMNVSSLSREFQKNLGQGFLDTVHRLRIEEAKKEIVGTEATLSEIAEKVGYTNPLTMTRAFKKYEGRLPSSYREEKTP